MCVDRSDNELSFLEFIHLFVETLDSYFGSVCELDLIFNFYKVKKKKGVEKKFLNSKKKQKNKCIIILDEMILGGEVMETSKISIMKRLELIDIKLKEKK